MGDREFNARDLRDSSLNLIGGNPKTMEENHTPGIRPALLATSPSLRW